MEAAEAEVEVVAVKVDTEEAVAMEEVDVKVEVAGMEVAAAVMVEVADVKVGMEEVVVAVALATPAVVEMMVAGKFVVV